MVGADFLLADIDSIGQMFSTFGIPLNWRDGIAPTPEAAVGTLFQQTGIPIAEIPRPQVYWAPLMTVPGFPIWELALASPAVATFDDGSATGPFTRVYVQQTAFDSIGFYLAAPDQPTQVWLHFPVSFNPIVDDSLPIPVVRPIAFRRIRFP
jgi:hypothetical protein